MKYNLPYFSVQISTAGFSFLGISYSSLTVPSASPSESLNVWEICEDLYQHWNKMNNTPRYSTLHFNEIISFSSLTVPSASP